MERIVENLQSELNESKDLIAALKLENEELKVEEILKVVLLANKSRNFFLNL